MYYDKIDVSSGKLIVSNKKLFSATKISGNVIRYKVDFKYNFNFDAGKNFLLIQIEGRRRTTKRANLYTILKS